MSIHKTIKDGIKDAMIKKDQVRLTTLRSLQAAFTNEMIAKKVVGDEIADEDALAVIRRLVKQRKDSIEQFAKGGRADLVKSEEAELKILEAFLPQMMSKDEVKKVVEAKMKEAGSVDKSKMGQFMGSVMKDLKGKADGTVVKEVIEELIK
jgi:uncharacterized protein YqeY